MRFGLFIPQGWRLDLVDIPTENHWPVMRDLAAYADDGAWDSLWVYDHFHTVPMPTDEATHEAWSLMSAYAATTSRIKLGQMCTAMGYRNPVYLAKVAATADIISGGRVQMGIGGGWYEHEWQAYGYGFPSAGVRLGRLDEGVQIMRDAWRDGRVSFARQALSGRRRDRRAEAVAGRRTSAVDRRRRREGDAAASPRSTRSTRTSPPSPTGSRTSRRCSPTTAATSAPTTTRSCARPTSTPSSASPRPTSRTASPGFGRGRSPRPTRQAVDAMLGTIKSPDSASRHTRTGRREAEADARPRLRVRDPLLPRGRLRPLRHRAVRARRSSRR